MAFDVSCQMHLQTCSVVHALTSRLPLSLPPSRQPTPEYTRNHQIG